MSNLKILFIIPSYQESISTRTFLSMIETVEFFSKNGIDYKIFDAKETLISVARNRSFNLILNNDFTHVFFIDSDIQFNYTSIIKIINHNVEFCGASFPYKGFFINDINTEFNNSKDGFDFLRRINRPVVNINKEDLFLNDQGLIKALDIGGAFFCLKRSVFEKLVDAYPKKIFLEIEPETGKEHKRYMFFESFFDQESARFLSEIHGFCKLWRDIGGEIFVDPDIDLVHIGSYPYSINLHNYLTGYQDS